MTLRLPMLRLKGQALLSVVRGGVTHRLFCRITGSLLRLFAANIRSVRELIGCLLTGVKPDLPSAPVEVAA